MFTKYENDLNTIFEIYGKWKILIMNKYYEVSSASDWKILLRHCHRACDTDEVGRETGIKNRIYK